MLRDRFVCGIDDERTQRRLLAERSCCLPVVGNSARYIRGRGEEYAGGEREYAGGEREYAGGEREYAVYRICVTLLVYTLL